MDIRYSVNQRDVKRYTSQELRNEFLIEKVFIEDDVTAVYSHVDRVVTLGALPKTQKLNIEKNIDCIEYVVLHELCHIFYMNHQKDFWTLVEKYMPDYKIRRKNLKNFI